MNEVVSNVFGDDHLEILHHKEGCGILPAKCSISTEEVGLVDVMSRDIVSTQYLESAKSSYDYGYRTSVRH